MEIVGKASGDCECFCWEVTEEEFKRVKGEDAWRFEKDYVREMNEDGFPTEEVWRLYPSDLIPDSIKDRDQDFIWELVIKPF